MYFPYFRGKQNELITVRENARLIAQANFVPIIEPVKESLNGLKRALDALNNEGAQAVVVVNPHHGDHVEDTQEIELLFTNELADHPNIAIGIILTDEITVTTAAELCEAHNSKAITLIHAGFTEARALVERLGTQATEIRHAFLENYCGKLYRKHFNNTQRILLRDGFKRRINREHPSVEFFSDLHATYEEERMDGFGDFLIVGNEFTETGGPAYAIAIHLTFIDSEKDDEMHIHHFISIRQDTPTDPAGKFAEALDKLVEEVERPNSMILRTSAVDEFIQLHERGHFPGLGYVKKLSMQHHIETLAEYFQREG